MELEQLEKQLSELNSEIKRLRDTKSELLEKMATFCPVNVGDIVEVNDWSHRGKPMIVDRVYYLENGQQSFTKHKFVCRGDVLKKDNTPSKFRGKRLV